MTRRRFVAVWLILFAAVPPALAQFDLSGRWHVTPATVAEFIHIDQHESQVSFALGSSGYSGTLQGDELPLTTFPADSGGAVIGANGNLLVLSTAAGSFVARRCQCDDGNGEDGDGCDSQCQIEPCFSCTGTPSVCTPLGDGAACSDGLDCTDGETCQSGICAGTRQAGCIDLSGRWLRRYDDHDQFFGESTDSIDIEQHDGFVLAGGAIGTLDSSGNLDLKSSLAGGPYCGIGSIEDAFVTADGNTLVGHGVALGPSIPFGCLSVFNYDVAAVRAYLCGDGAVTFPEQCDTGSDEPGVCCNANCLMEEDAGACVRDCVGDCDRSGAVAISELIEGVGFALNKQPPYSCPLLDADRNHTIEIAELVRAVKNALSGCPFFSITPVRS